MPEDEAGFIGLVESFSNKFKSAINQLQETALRQERRSILKSEIGNNYAVKEWRGTIAEMTTDFQGKAALAIKISPIIIVRTWNNILSDSLGGRTMIDSQSELYGELMNLAVGDEISFSGHFVGDDKDADYLIESNLSIENAMTDPDFIFQFNSVKPVFKDYYPIRQSVQPDSGARESLGNLNELEHEQLVAEMEAETAERESQLATSAATKNEVNVNEIQQASRAQPSFNDIFINTKFWTADWGNDIRAALSKSPCKEPELARTGYKFRAYSSIPVSRLKKQSEAWYIFDDRAVSVSGCWFSKGEGLIHFKMTRKKDNKVFEEDANLNDGTWVATPYIAE